MAKARRTGPELQEAIMQEVRRRREWNDILNVTIIKRSPTAPQQPNWDAIYIMDGRRVVPEGAFRLVTNLQNVFDLA